MKVFKFGGASVNTIERIKNVAHILRLQQEEKLVVIISAMGKTTNALEKVVEAFFAGNSKEALDLFEIVKQSHLNTAKFLLVTRFNPTLEELVNIFTEVEWLLHDKPVKDFDYYYDQVVCAGELLSTRIVSAYLNEAGITNQWLDVRDIIRTDDNFRDANVDFEITAQKLQLVVGGWQLMGKQRTDDSWQLTEKPLTEKPLAVDSWSLVAEQMTDNSLQLTEEQTSNSQEQTLNLKPSTSNLEPQTSNLPTIFITQGFIGATDENESTTLGREGSDYSAAIFANLLNAESVTIWKDVEGVMSADPKEFPEATLIDELSFTEVIEMAYYGAQVIHPKTIKPLQNKKIPLVVKSFINPTLKGTVISSKNVRSLPPIIVIKQSQVLIHLRTHNFSFVGEEPMGRLYKIFSTIHVKPNLIQTGAISLQVCLDDHAEKIDQLALAASEVFDVQLEKELTLLTIRHYTEELLQRMLVDKEVVLVQKTKKTVQVLYR